MLDNGQVETQQIKDIQEDIDNYIENSQEPEFYENEYIYDDISGLDAMLLDVSPDSEMRTEMSCNIFSDRSSGATERGGERDSEQHELCVREQPGDGTDGQPQPSGGSEEETPQVGLDGLE